MCMCVCAYELFQFDCIALTGSHLPALVFIIIIIDILPYTIHINEMFASIFMS